MLLKSIIAIVFFFGRCAQLNKHQLLSNQVLNKKGNVCISTRLKLPENVSKCTNTRHSLIGCYGMYYLFNRNKFILTFIFKHFYNMISDILSDKKCNTKGGMLKYIHQKHW